MRFSRIGLHCLSLPPMPAAVRNKGSRRHHSVSFINLQMIHLAERARTLSSRLVRSPAGAGLGLSKSLRSFNDAAPAEPSNVGGGLGGATAEKAGYRHRRLLRARRERPRRRCPAEQADELAAPHSITSSARASRLSGRVRPRALAVLRFITSSYFVGACTGRSAGFSPLRMRST